MDDQQFEQLQLQAGRGETDVVLAAVDAEPGLVTRAGMNGYTLLHNACRGEHVDLARGLLDRKANIHQRTNGGWDALIIASLNGHVPVLVLLISRGADVNARDNAGRTALAFAALWDILPTCLYLISQQADLLSVDDDGESVLEGYGHNSEEEDEQVNELRRGTLREAFAEAKIKRLEQEVATQAKEIESQAAKIAILKRPALATASMLFSEDFSDLVFVAGGERIPAHRFILAASSEHMGALLKGPWRENVEGQAVEVPMEQSAVAVRVMLQFVFTGEIDEAGLSSDVMGVLDLSSRHLLPELKAACERCLVGSLTVPTIPEALVTAHLYDLTDLEAACVELIKANLAAVTFSSSFMKLKRARPAIWKQLRGAVGLPAEEEQDEEEEEEEEEGPQQKSARRET